MALKNNVQILSVSKVGPPSPDTNATAAAAATPVILPLTYFDILFLKSRPTERVFFYQITGLTRDSFDSVIVPKLKHSLSLTLLHYLPLAGHIMWPNDASKPSIYYFPGVDGDGSGVSVAVAESDADFNHLSGDGSREVADFHHLTAELPISDDKAAVVSVQITLFPNQGFCISVLPHHAAMDGKSSTMFIRSWAYICNQLLRQSSDSLIALPAELTPCFDRTALNDPDGFDVVYANHWQAFFNTRSLKLITSDSDSDSNDIGVRRSFELTRQDIKKLRDMVQEQRQSKEELHLSAFVIACAYVYVCIVQAIEEEANTNVMFWVTADCRSRLDPPLSVNYFGNCVNGHGTIVKASQLSEGNKGIAFVAEKLSELVKGINKEVIEGSEEKIVRFLTFVKGGGGLQYQGGLYLSAFGSNRFDVYGSDFGWGKPKKVDTMIRSIGGVSLVESRNGGGAVEVGVVLKKQQMPAFISLYVNGLK